MADIAAFPTLKQVLHNDGPVYGFTAGADIKAGQVVALSATTATLSVKPAVAGTTGEPIGVAILPAASGAPVSVALAGSIVTVANADDTTAIDSGVAVADNAVAGAVAAAATDATNYSIGVSIEKIAGGETGKIIIMPQIITKAAS